MTVQARELDDSHVGAELSYGPSMMFSGTIVEIIHSTNVFMGGRDEIRPMKTPSRVYVTTTDHRAVTLNHDARINVRSLGTNEGET